MHQSQILPLGPHFAIRLISMAHFRSKNIFCKPNIKDAQKLLWKVLLWLQFAFFKEKKIYFDKFFRFLRFSQNQLPGGKIWDCYIILHYFANIWHLCWPRVRIHIEIGDLRPRTPCVLRVYQLEQDQLGCTFLSRFLLLPIQCGMNRNILKIWDW